jgi:hypothetical protein
MSTPTQRTLKALRLDGYTAEVVEKWIPMTRQRKDLFGVIDILAMRPGEILGVQTTSGSNLSARLAKARAEPRLAAWLAAGGKFVVHGWAKRGKRGERKLWQVRTETITAGDMEAT